MLLIPYHAAMAWNSWGEPNYISFGGNRIISSLVVFFSPYFMPLLFVLSGIGTKFSLEKRTVRQYLIERANKLLVPFLFGTIVLMPIMSYIADRFNCSYSGGFLEHYAVFFTRYTDLTGADGGFSLGQFWFLLYLLIISVVAVAVIALLKRIVLKPKRAIPFWVIFLLGLPLPLLSGLLSVGGKSLAEYLYLFLLGYYVFTDKKIIDRIEKNCLLLSGIGLAASALNVYLFVWSEADLPLFSIIARYVSEWVMVIALIGLAKRYLDFSGKASDYMSKRSFLFYIYHFVWVVLFQYVLSGFTGNSTFILFLGTVLLAYPATFATCEVSIRIPFLCFVTGTKYPFDKRLDGDKF